MFTIDISNEAQMQREVVEIIKRFRALPKEIAKRRMRAAIKKASKPFEPTLRANTPYHTGSLGRSITTKIRVYDKPTHGAVVAITGYTRGTLKKKRGQFVISGSGSHAIIVEKGTKARYRKNGGYSGVMPARYMTRRTLDATKTQVLSSMRAELAAALEKTAKELAK